MPSNWHSYVAYTEIFKQQLIRCIYKMFMFFWIYLINEHLIYFFIIYLLCLQNKANISMLMVLIVDAKNFFKIAKNALCINNFISTFLE